MNQPVTNDAPTGASPEFQYAYYFPEGSGYLYVDHLGSGMDGVVDIVWSCAQAAQEVTANRVHAQSLTDSQGMTFASVTGKNSSNKLYVRKKTSPMLPFGNDLNLQRYPMAMDEIRHFRRHPRVPELVDWTEYRPLSITHQYHLHLTAVAMIFQYCNGGNLHRVIREYLGLRRLYQALGDVDRLKYLFIPEAFIWKAFGQVLQVADWLHHQRPGIYHADIHCGNVFLHFASDQQLMPDCLLGDFGRSKIMVSRAWDPNGTPAVHGVNPYMQEYQHLLAMIKQLITLTGLGDSTSNSETTAEQYKHMRDNDMHYSELLYDQIRRFENKIEDCQVDGSNPDFSLLAKNMIGFGESMNGLQATSLQNINRRHRMEPQTFNTVDDLLQVPDQHRPAGPWKVAKIRTDTKEVVALSREVYRTYQPLGYVGEKYADDLRGDDSHSIPGSDGDTPVEQL